MKPVLPITLLISLLFGLNINAQNLNVSYDIYSPDTIVDDGRINIFILSDGYQSSESAVFDTSAGWFAYHVFQQIDPATGTFFTQDLFPNMRNSLTFIGFLCHRTVLVSTTHVMQLTVSQRPSILHAIHF